MYSVVNYKLTKWVCKQLVMRMCVTQVFLPLNSAGVVVMIGGVGAPLINGEMLKLHLYDYLSGVGRHVSWLVIMF